MVIQIHSQTSAKLVLWIRNTPRGIQCCGRRCRESTHVYFPRHFVTGQNLGGLSVMAAVLTPRRTVPSESPHIVNGNSRSSEFDMNYAAMPLFRVFKYQHYKTTLRFLLSCRLEPNPVKLFIAYDDCSGQVNMSTSIVHRKSWKGKRTIRKAGKQQLSYSQSRIYPRNQGIARNR